MITDSEEILVGRAQRGDRGAFAELVRRTTQLVYARLYLETGDAHQTEDLVQETYLNAFRMIGQLTNVERFRAWLVRIAQNTAIDANRHGQRKKRIPGPEIHLHEPTVPAPEAQLEAEELRQKILGVLRGMPEEYRLPLMLRYLVGANHESIQAEMGLSNGSLRGVLHRGVQRLRAQMRKVLGDSYPSCGQE